MSTAKNTQTEVVLKNKTTNREATTNDLIKYAMVKMLAAETEEDVLKYFKILNEQKEINKKNEKETYHFPKQLKRVWVCLGKIEVKKEVVKVVVSDSEDL